MKKQEHDSAEPYLPKTGWFGKYLKFSEGLETCPRFRFFCAASALGAAINNKVWIQRGDEDLLPKLFPNVWVMLLAPPGRGHKTSAINMAVNCLTSACDDVRILADKLTPEYLVKALSTPTTQKEMIRIGPRDATGLIKAPELSVFFGKQQYNVGLVSLVTDLYDYREKWTGGTIGRGGETLRNVCISVLGGSTPDWLQQMLPQDAFTGGFMSRFVIVEMPPTYFKRMADPKKPKDLHWKELIEGLNELSKLSGVVEWGSKSKEKYEEFYIECAPVGDPQKDAYKERETEQILKLAILFAISEKRLVITGKEITQAHDLLHALYEEIDPRIDRLTTHPRMHLAQEIQDILKMYGEMKESVLLERVYRLLSQGERQFYETLSVLKRANIIKISGDKGDWTYSLKKGARDDNRVE